MIESKDLRIGNWFYNGLTDKYGDLIPTIVRAIPEVIPEDLFVEPIPLTTEVLIKCGLEFKKGIVSNPDAMYADFDQYRIYAYGGKNSIHFNTNGNYFPTIREVKYLHEFQNWYYFTITHELLIHLSLK